MSVWDTETRHVIEHYEGDARASGLGDVWEHLIAQEDSGARTLTLGIVGALSTYLVETGYASRVT